MKRKIIAGFAVAAALLCAAWLYGATSADDASSADDGLRALEQRVADLERRVATLENPEAQYLPLGRPEDADRTP